MRRWIVILFPLLALGCSSLPKLPPGICWGQVNGVPAPVPCTTPTPVPTVTPTPEPTSIPTPEPTAIPTPVPTPVSSWCIGPLSKTWVADQDTSLRSDEIDAINRVMEEITGCNVGSDCKIELPFKEWTVEIIQRLSEKGWCVGQHVQWQDKVAIGSRWANRTYHTYNFGGEKVAWQPNNAEQPSAWVAEGPEEDTCSIPVPVRESLNISAGMRQNVYPAGCFYEVTPNVGNQCEFCRLIGLGTYGSSIRCGCSVRPDGAQDRVACEHVVLGGGPPKFELEYGNGGVDGNNPFRFVISHGSNAKIRACDFIGGSCTAWLEVECPPWQ